MSKKEALLQELKDCIKNLSEVLGLPKDAVVRDSSIKRFELAADIAWKTVKEVLLEDFGVIVNSPKSAFREAFKQGLIEYQDDWIAMVDTRNETVHTYREELAEEIYNKLPGILTLLQGLLASLEKPPVNK